MNHERIQLNTDCCTASPQRERILAEEKAVDEALRKSYANDISEAEEKERNATRAHHLEEAGQLLAARKQQVG